MDGQLYRPREQCTNKNILADELRNNHTTKNWYVPLGTALLGLTAEQADWKDNLDNHATRELASHLAFWNERILTGFKRDPLTFFDEDNESTFRVFDKVYWDEALSQLDSIQRDWDDHIQQSTKKQIADWGSEIASMSSHNAYHTGQIVYIRKRNGWWDKSVGVK